MSKYTTFSPRRRPFDTHFGTSAPDIFAPFCLRCSALLDWYVLFIDRVDTLLAEVN